MTEFFFNSQSLEQIAGLLEEIDQLTNRNLDDDHPKINIFEEEQDIINEEL